LFLVALEKEAQGRVSAYLHSCTCRNSVHAWTLSWNPCTSCVQDNKTSQPHSQQWIGNSCNSTPNPSALEVVVVALVALELVSHLRR